MNIIETIHSQYWAALEMLRSAKSRAGHLLRQEEPQRRDRAVQFREFVVRSHGLDLSQTLDVNKQIVDWGVTEKAGLSIRSYWVSQKQMHKHSEPEEHFRLAFIPVISLLPEEAVNHQPDHYKIPGLLNKTYSF